MAKLTSQALEAWNNHDERMVLTTTSQDNAPNSIWVICAKLINDDQFVIANNAFSKTLQNINLGSRGSLLYIAPERESYQVKGTLEYHTDGPIYDDMKIWLDPKFPGKGALVLNIEEVYYGAEQVV
ncbi:MAG: pyridoxamine 5'-phosphate oxidase family protein [Gammaproteobacteria bacterium]|nr:MAG: pyridoxamine 5'-phosphate oxidase family protein [Gammaproteobacteria bacterium]